MALLSGDICLDLLLPMFPCTSILLLLGFSGDTTLPTTLCLTAHIFVPGLTLANLLGVSYWPAPIPNSCFLDKV